MKRLIARPVKGCRCWLYANEIIFILKECNGLPGGAATGVLMLIMMLA